MASWSTPPNWTSGQTSGVSTGLQKLSDNLTVVGSAWTAYTPTWSAATTAPVLNNGTLVGRYRQVNKTVNFLIQITMGSSTTYGSGTWTITLPPTGVHGERLTFIGHGFDSSAGGIVPLLGTSGGSTLTLLAWPTTAGGYASGVAATAPFSWATSDVLTISGTYETA